MIISIFLLCIAQAVLFAATPKLVARKPERELPLSRNQANLIAWTARLARHSSEYLPQ